MGWAAWYQIFTSLPTMGVDILCALHNWCWQLFPLGLPCIISIMVQYIVLEHISSVSTHHVSANSRLQRDCLFTSVSVLGARSMLLSLIFQKIRIDLGCTTLQETLWHPNHVFQPHFCLGQNVHYQTSADLVSICMLIFQYLSSPLTRPSKSHQPCQRSPLVLTLTWLMERKVLTILI